VTYSICVVTELTRLPGLLDALLPVHLAAYDASGAAPACLKGTRTALLDSIAEWMKDPSAKRIYWLTGVAGTGKTTVAQSVARMAHDEDCLGATFFFSRTAETVERRRAAAVIPTIAYQLATKHSALHDAICRAVASNKDIRTSQISIQIQKLLSLALSSIKGTLPRPLVVVVDALDECDKEAGREGGELVPLLLDALDGLPFCVKLFITSRPEATIRNMFQRTDIRGATRGLALHRDIADDVVRRDVGQYLRHEFDKLIVERGIATQPFPSPSDFATLLDRAGTLFIYVRTVMTYISDQLGEPEDQLADILQAGSLTLSDQFADLDGLYLQILNKALDGFGRPTVAQFRDVLSAIVLLEENLPLTAFIAVAGVDVGRCKRVLRALSSVLLYDHRPEEPIRVMHPSFPDFVLDRCGSSDFKLAMHECHHRFALHCLQILNSGLRRNICDIEDSSLLNSEVPDLQQRLAGAVPSELRYAAKFWHVHLRECMGACDDLSGILGQLDEFCSTHLLHWVELMSLLGDFSVVQLGIPPLLSAIQVRTSILGTVPKVMTRCPAEIRNVD
jgi:hypothetical protein